MHWLHVRGVNLALNDHPGYANTDASDLSYHDSQAEEVLRDLGRPLPARPTFTLDLARHWRFSAGPYHTRVRRTGRHVAADPCGAQLAGPGRTGP